MSGEYLIQNHDGADHQSQAILSMVRYLIGDGIEDAWNDAFRRYDAEPRVTRYDNGREQGYIVFMRGPSYKGQINLAFYKHRNSDAIYIQRNEVETFNAPTAQQIYEGMESKRDCAKSFGVGQITEAATYIADELREFWSKDES